MISVSPAPVDLIAGSEGTLAFVWRLTRPVAAAGGTASLLSSWPSLEHAVHGAALAREADAAACELLDGTFLRGGRGPAAPGPRRRECVLGNSRREALCARAERWPGLAPRQASA
jgi:hypothetical protein